MNSVFFSSIIHFFSFLFLSLLFQVGFTHRSLAWDASPVVGRGRGVGVLEYGNLVLSDAAAVSSLSACPLYVLSQVEMDLVS